MNKYQSSSYSKLPRLQSHPRFSTFSNSGKILLLVVLHILLAFLMRNFRMLATVHALLVFFIGLYTAVTQKDMRKVLPITAYIIGAEVLWRMTGANVFWEFGKYATVAILMVAILKKGKIKHAGLPVLFFLVLIPSMIKTVDLFGLSERTREMISFNLSGPLAAAVCMLYFKQIKISIKEMKDWVWPAVYPIIGILTLAAYSTITAKAINFGNESVFVTSGGFGPNQVSAMLGLGALLLMMLAITAEKGSGRFWAVILSFGLIIQSFLTFSRGGIYNFGIGLTAAVLHLLGKPDKFIKITFLLLVVGIILFLLVIPQLDIYTQGALTTRFTDVNTTGRLELAQADLELFLENPAFGVGPGMSSLVRSSRAPAAAHTEYTRLLAEHGVWGILAILILLLLLLQGYIKAPDIVVRAWVVALAGWPLVEMAHAAMRVAAISFMLGMAVVNWRQEISTEGEDEIVYMNYPVK